MVSNQRLIKFKGNDYIAKFPNVGQMMEIENNKMSLTNGKYVDMAMSALKIHVFQLDMVDTISYFSVLIPTIKEQLEIKNWRDLDANVAKELVLVYKKQFIPWFKPLLDDLLKIESDDESETDQQ
jgi:hypothetical protein